MSRKRPVVTVGYIPEKVIGVRYVLSHEKREYPDGTVMVIGHTINEGYWDRYYATVWDRGRGTLYGHITRHVQSSHDVGQLLRAWRKDSRYLANRARQIASYSEMVPQQEGTN